MNLAEALIQRKDLTTKLANLKTRAENVASKVEGRDPVEDPVALIADVERTNAALTDLVVRINKTNQLNGIAEMSVKRNQARQMSQFYQSMAQSARSEGRRGYGLSSDDRQYTPAVEIAGMEAMAQQWADTARELDMKIQKMDWEIEVE